MGRKNHSTQAKKQNMKDKYDVDYMFMPEHPEIAAVIAPQMKTIYRNMSCAPWADEVHIAKNEKDKYLAEIRRMY